MYYKSRGAAGRLLAEQIFKKYQSEDCAVVALSDGASVVGVHVAQKLQAVLMLLMTAPIEIPQEPIPIGAIAPDGSFRLNKAYSDADLEMFGTEYRNHIELEKMYRVNEMHKVSGEGDLIRRELLQDKNVILVSDGLHDGLSVDLAFEFLKPIRTKKIIVATPVANVPAVDRIHIQADDVFCLSVVADYFTTDHYYDTKDVPDHNKVIQTIEGLVRSWSSDNTSVQ